MFADERCCFGLLWFEISEIKVVLLHSPRKINSKILQIFFVSLNNIGIFNS